MSWECREKRFPYLFGTVVTLTSYRRNPITGEPVLFAPERAARPHAFASGANEGECPFCPGREHDTPPELVRLGDPWQARLFPNKYPPAPGSEVVVESPLHDATFADLDHAADVVRIYLDRYRHHRGGGAPYVAIFKNEGARAGSSIAHLHSQIVPVAVVPPRIEREIEGFARAVRCPLCPPLNGHLIEENEHFSWIAPYGSAFPYQQWLVPKKHVQEAFDFNAVALAPLLRRATRAMLRVADAYNWAFVTFPGHRSAHAYIDLFPRMTSIAGFELGTGMFVEIIDPAATAQAFRRDDPSSR
jgi:UDPglucose--hexose-1-phosphate uridylyltransferase